MPTPFPTLAPTPAPTPAPTLAPSPPPSPAPTSAPTPPRIKKKAAPPCEDSVSFRDKFAYSCADWRGHDCEFYTTWWRPYSNADRQRVRENCNKSCGVCTECKDEYRFRDKFGFSCGHWNGHDCTKPEHWHHVYSDAELLKVMEHCPLTCGTCAGR
mmetsp:Transcript_36556/g.113975  ORF Transcript_36556/g.113975 Transcript_36556/m.113975 type:complete len:156 (-) Transcript_36556:55-522(-)